MDCRKYIKKVPMKNFVKIHKENKENNIAYYNCITLFRSNFTIALDIMLRSAIQGIDIYHHFDFYANKLKCFS